MKMASPSIEASGSVIPPSYPEPVKDETTNSKSRTTNTKKQAVVVAPEPFFDSILRAAPAFDDENEPEGGNYDSPSSSTLSLPLHLKLSNSTSHWTIALKPHLQQHASLHAFLDANSKLNEKIAQLTDSIHINAGKRTSVATRITHLQRKLHEVQLQSDKRLKLLLSPKKRKEMRRQIQDNIAELEPLKEHHLAYEERLARDREELTNLEIQAVEFAKVNARLDAIDDEVFGGLTHDHQDEDELEQQYHVHTETIKRLNSSILVEQRCQRHLNRAHHLTVSLIKELLTGLNIGIEIGVPTNQKHKTGLWRGSSPTHSANRSRIHILRAKTLCGDIHQHYILSRAVQRRVAVLPKLTVIELNRLPGMNAKDVLNESGLHRSLEQSYAQAKIAKTHMEGQLRHSKERQASLKRRIKEIQGEAKDAWLVLRSKRREIVEEYRKDQDIDEIKQLQPLDLGKMSSSLPPYKSNLLSSSTLGLQVKDRNDAVFLPLAFRNRVDKESMARSKIVVRQVAIEVGGWIEDDNVEDHELVREEEDLPGTELLFEYNKNKMMNKV